MNDTTISLRGYVASDVILRDAGDFQVANFRVGATPRLLNRASGEWYDGPTQWYSVVAWRQLGLNVKRSIFKGEPVVVHGRLTIQEWADKDGVLRTTLEVDADSVGHDLVRGTSVFARPAKPATATETGPAAGAGSDPSDPWAVPGVVPEVNTPLHGEAVPEPAEAEAEAEQDPIADWRAA